mmetsp:Transcript_43128/g.100147  ORF Transcript_43128/g.100147 Transcript_43128/m.100147 type:complete len:109 (+) Transcript_43128:263-589(+)
MLRVTLRCRATLNPHLHQCANTVKAIKTRAEDQRLLAEHLLDCEHPIKVMPLSSFLAFGGIQRSSDCGWCAFGAGSCNAARFLPRTAGCERGTSPRTRTLRRAASSGC